MRNLIDIWKVEGVPLGIFDRISSFSPRTGVVRKHMLVLLRPFPDLTYALPYAR